MARRARIHFVSLRSSLVNLPISLYGPLLERSVRPQHLAVHLKRVEGAASCEAYVGWTGLASASSLAHFQSAEKGLESIDIDPQYAQSLGFNEGDTVEIGLLHDLPSASMVITEPVTSDDWEIIEIHASHVESNLLSQVRVALPGQELNVWVMGRTRIRLKVVTLQPPSDRAVLLTSDTEVSIAPKPHKPASSNKPSTQPKPLPSSEGEASKPTDSRSPTNSQTLRVLPSRLCSTPLHEYIGSEILGYVSPATLDALRAGRDTESVRCTVGRAPPPTDPSASNSGISSKDEPPLPSKSLSLNKASAMDEKTDEKTQKEVFIGSSQGLPENHIVFIGTPNGVGDWDLVTIVPSDELSDQVPSPQLDGVTLRSTTPRRHSLAGVDDILDKATAFCFRKFAMHSLSQVVHGVPSLLITGRTGSGKTSIVKTIARTLQDDPKTFTYTYYINIDRHSEQPVATLKSLLKYWFDKAAFHKPSVLILDNLDKLLGTESEHADSFRTRHLTELFLSIFSSSSRTAMPNARGIVLLATASSTASLHPMLHTAHTFQDVINLQPPNKNARRDILSTIVQNRLDIAQDIRQDASSPLNFTALATQTEGYSATDLKDLVSRAMHQYAIRASQKDLEEAYLTSSDFEAAQANFVPLSLRDAKLQTSDVAWADIGGLQDTRRILRETLEWPTKYGPIFAQSPLRLRSGLLLYGHPGCGKTLLASAVAKECGLNFISVKGPEILNKYIGASEKSVRDLFERASAAKPCVLFFDEFESIAPKRGHDSTGVTDRVVNQMLTQMDGAEGLDGVYVLAATSRPDLIDSALLRPGRLDKSLLCGMPDIKDREEILSVVGQKIALSSSVDLTVVAERTEGFSGADLQALLYNAHLETIHSSLDRSDEVKQLDEEEGAVNYLTFGSSMNQKTASKAEEMALQKRLRRIQASSRPAQTKFAQSASSKGKGKSKEHAVTMDDIEKALNSMRPSVTNDERFRLDRIYRAFISDREGNNTIPPEGGNIGSRATLA